LAKTSIKETKMNELLAAFVVFGLVIVGMAVGVIFSNRQIKGSCGGLNTMSDQFGQPMCECGAKPGACDASDQEPKTADVFADAEEVVART